MDHPLHTISFVADVGNTLVIMVRLPPSTTSKMTCHVLDACNVQTYNEPSNVCYNAYLLGEASDPCDW